MWWEHRKLRAKSEDKWNSKAYKVVNYHDNVENWTCHCQSLWVLPRLPLWWPTPRIDRVPTSESSDDSFRTPSWSCSKYARIWILLYFTCIRTRQVKVGGNVTTSLKFIFSSNFLSIKFLFSGNSYYYLGYILNYWDALRPCTIILSLASKKKILWSGSL